MGDTCVCIMIHYNSSPLVLTGGLFGRASEHILLLLLFYFVFFSSFGSDGLMCGVPGKAENGLVKLYSSTLYSPGQRADYKCTTGFTLVGNTSRVCHENGMWSGSIPHCAENLAFSKSISSSPLISHYEAPMVVDGNLESCVYFDIHTNNRFAQIDLGRNYYIEGLTFYVPPGYTQEVTVFVAEKLNVSPGVHYRPCTSSSTQIDHMLYVKCSDEDGRNAVLPGRYIHVRDERKVHDFYFSLCEIEVNAPPQDRLASTSPWCGTPDQPAFGVQKRVSHNFYEYSCSLGFVLNGSKFLHCPNGSWLGKAPTCIAIECPPLKPIDFGYFDLYPIRGLSNYSFNSAAHYRCFDGYKLHGNLTQTCTERAQWTGSQPSCRPTDCGLPRQVTNAFYQLIDNHTRPGAVVEYFCKDGFSAHRIFNSKSIQMSTICQTNGYWKDVFFFCLLTNNRPISTIEFQEETTTPPDVKDETTVKTRPLQEIDYVLQTVVPSTIPEVRSRSSTSSNVTTIATTGLITAFIIIMMAILGITLNICKMRTVVDYLTKCATITAGAQLINANRASKDCYGPSYDSKKKETLGEIEQEPVYNELDQSKVVGLNADTNTNEIDNATEENFYLEIGGTEMAMEMCAKSPPVISVQEATHKTTTTEDILQLYAQVDKTKKKKNRLAKQQMEEYVNSDVPRTVQLDGNCDNKGKYLRDAQTTATEPMNNEDPSPTSVHLGITENAQIREAAEFRPLPPLPNDSLDVDYCSAAVGRIEEKDHHIYATLKYRHES